MPADEPPAAIRRATSVPMPVDEHLVWVGYRHSSILPWFGPSLSATSRRAPIPASGALTFLCRSAFFGELEVHAGALEDHRLTAPSFPHRSDQHRCDTREGDCEKRADDSRSAPMTMASSAATGCKPTAPPVMRGASTLFSITCITTKKMIT